MFFSRPAPAFRFRRWVHRFAWCAAIGVAMLLIGQRNSPAVERAYAAGVVRPDVPHAPLPTTLKDFHLPGSQPNSLTVDLQSCGGCHVDIISKNYAGSMMANSVRDPLFRAALQVANEDADFAGEFCIRCHAPNAWLNGRSVPSDGSAFTADDMQGITCNSCHRMVAPYAIVDESARNVTEREHIKSSQQTLLMIGSGAYVVDREDYRRGPYDLNIGQHKTTQDSFMRSSLMCATCHEIDNPLLTYDTNSEEFRINALDTPAPVGAKLFPIERTFSEWQYSAFNTSEGVAELSSLYPGLKRQTMTVDGPITVCQDCHMPMVESSLTTLGTPQRHVGMHEWAGGSAKWQTGIEAFWDDVAGDSYFDTISEAATLASIDAAESMLGRAAELQLRFDDRTLYIDVVNNTGHKLPTGYAEGRRMWLEVIMLKNSTVITSLGGFDGEGKLVDPIKVYEIKLGISENHAADIGRPEIAGEGFHFALNNQVFKDNRIPPRGWTNAQYATRSMQPVGATYADGVYTDTTTLELPPSVNNVQVKLWYQTASGEYLDFLETEADDLVFDAVVNGNVNWGETVGQLRDQFDLDAPVLMRSSLVSVPELAIEKTVFPSAGLLPGQPITFSLVFSNPGFVSIGKVGIADSLSPALSNVNVETQLDSNVTLNQTGNAPNLAWSVEDLLDSGSTNTILIHAKVNAQLNADVVIQNSATISGSVVANVIHRTAEVSAGVIVPRVQFAPSGYSVEEDGGIIEVVVSMDKPNPYAVTTFTVSTQEGSARAGEDFIALDQVQITIPAGASSAKVPLQLINDTVAENNEFFRVIFVSTSGAAIGAAQSATITVNNEDEGPVTPNNFLYMPVATK